MAGHLKSSGLFLISKVGIIILAVEESYGIMYAKVVENSNLLS